MVSPGWLASTEHVPDRRVDTCEPDTRHTDVVSDWKLTLSPEFAEADNAVGAVEYVRLAMDENVIDWEALVMENERVTLGAAFQLMLPG